MSKTIKLDDDVSAVLRAMRVDHNVAFLTSGQLARDHYQRVDKALKALGGKWNRKIGGHVFAFDPRAALGQAVEDGSVVDQKKSLGQFFTPPDIAERMVDELYLGRGMTVLEPSCGDGRIVRALLKDASQVLVQGLEIDSRLVAQVRSELAGNRFSVAERDFLAQSPKHHMQYDRVAMNPPFNSGADIEHIEHALRFLKPGGYLVAICAAGPRQDEFFRAKFDDRLTASGFWEPLPVGTFKAEGTDVSAAMIMLHTLDRPPTAAYRPPAPSPKGPPLPMLELMGVR